ncbi:MAG: antitoxin [Oscillibacter sp.]|nr:antitoxin [Oscillibacter sp.]
MGRTSASSKNRWNAANYDRIGVMARKGEKEEIRAAAEKCGESVNAYILEAVRRRMAEEQKM